MENAKCFIELVYDDNVNNYNNKIDIDNNNNNNNNDNYNNF